MTAYLDASILVALIMDDALSERADAFMRGGVEVLVVSDFAATEFASAVSRQLRNREITAAQAREGFADFDAWIAAETQRAETTRPI